ncbi:MAG: trehalose-6-phosphate synthase [Rhodospirillaceae bacterium]|nr:trehalose-6-phosphate synthase [Rhodospirillaceae bacterium]
MKRIVVISNRVGLAEPGGEAAGGLVTGVQAAMHGRGGLWFGWSGKIVTAPGDVPTVTRNGALEIATVDLSHASHSDYYLGFANGTLWPLCHFRLGLIEYERSQAEAYAAENARFARVVAPLLRADDLVWVHDYHLIPLARELRRIGCTQKLGFFLHIPLPPPRALAILPRHTELFSALLDYDLVGFQTADDADAFRAFCREHLGHLIMADGSVVGPNRRTATGVFPIGIDPVQQQRIAADSVTRSTTRRLVDSLGGRKLILGVDRLDYSKGLSYRFQAVGRLLAERPEWRGRFTYLQIAAPSRIEIGRYREAKRELERLAGKVNGKFSEFDWMPIRYLNRAFKPSTLAGFYRVAQVGLVTPLRDGMNLVAKEYVGSQAPADPGVLVLSPFAGAAAELDDALIANPFDIDALAEAIHTALTMSPEERRRRWSALNATVAAHDAERWQRNFLAALEAAPPVLATAAGD